MLCFALDNFCNTGNSRLCSLLRYEQELSYRQQIARKLRTRYAESIYRHKYYTVTLKSRLRVTQGHWKRNHWIDHTTFWRYRLVKYKFAQKGYTPFSDFYNI